MSPHAHTRQLVSMTVILALTAVASPAVPAHAVADTTGRNSAPPLASFDRVSASGSRDAFAPLSWTEGRVPARPSFAAIVAAGTGPVNPIPDTLWEPSAGSVPVSGNYVYLDSDAGDYIGLGREYLYTPANAAITVSASGGHLSVGINGNESWSGSFQTMNSISQLEPGYYPGLQRYPFHNPVTGGLNWSGEGRGSNTLTGWFVVDSVTYAGGALTAIDLRFEQHSEGGAPALHGAIRWTADDQTQPGGPVNPIPDTLWEPSAGSVPVSGNYVYLDSDAGDYIGQGREYLYTPANAAITVSASGGHLSVGINGNEWWNGDFQTMNSIAQLQPGYYPGLQRYPFHNPVTGGLNWSGEGRGSNTLTGWFVVDSVTYAGGALTAIDLRFEQHSEGGAPALHGAIHWTADDPTQPGGPADNIPGVPLPPSPVSGSLDEGADKVFQVQLSAGQFLGLYLVGDPGVDVDLYVFGPEATSVYTDEPRVGDQSDEYPKGGWYACTESGLYYVDLYAASGSGSYTLQWAVLDPDPRPVYRFYNARQGVHFYTASEAEKSNVITTLSSVYRFEGVSYSANAASPFNSTPLYRFYNFKKGVHFYTASEAEKDNVVATLSSTYRLEGVAYNVSPTSANAFPVYRFYNTKAGVHFYTASETEKNNVINTLSRIYSFEGVAYYVGR